MAVRSSASAKLDPYDPTSRDGACPGSPDFGPASHLKSAERMRARYPKWSPTTRCAIAVRLPVGGRESLKTEHVLEATPGG